MCCKYVTYLLHVSVNAAQDTHEQWNSVHMHHTHRALALAHKMIHELQ
jgi:hypothetical protein